ncbi:helix-turn-helix domain protein [Desulfofundulus kuznetsovii DSM 6115]|uniref:Helix-turn-helix domain protein n=1 Tax=Desulfofundulus kuznetsovii (strain DSM 6115 / VKM B-1805 / 17) TaxID=760568 RepID=A0AAU8PDT3_DESK7|nr:helix-turn-helix domain protein [Desulfofundulus kuznetsovii DSM 6115]
MSGVRNEKMYQLRLKMGLSQRQVAEAVGISQSSYAMIEGGHRHPRKEVEKKLADFFGVTVDELFFGRDNHGSRLEEPDPGEQQ